MLLHSGIILLLILIGICALWAIIFIKTFSCYRSHVANKKKNIGWKIRQEFLKNMPPISVIIPARNEQEHIERCLLSILNQNYPNFEVIMIDDNSNDNTVQRARHLQRKFIAQSRKLEIIEVKSKPPGWTGKTWASEQGLLRSRNSILVFLDADCYYSPNCLLFAMSYMINNKLDVVTGYPLFDLKDFWSKVSMPFWKVMSFTFQDDATHVNDPNSKVAYLMGCFFMTKRGPLIKVGSFTSVRNAIQEDKVLGQKLKYSGYKVNMVQMDSFIVALWSRNLSTLWQGLARTISPMMINQKKAVFINFISIFVLGVLPLLLAASYLLLPIEGLVQTNIISSNFYLQVTSVGIYLFTFELTTFCVMMMIVNMSKIFPGYALLSPLGGLFLTLVYLATILPLIISAGKSKRIEWKGRIYTYNRIGGNMI
jgi:chlorobactene glucosyltransferase